MQVSILFVPLQSLTKGKHIGELAEWSNAAVLKTVDLNGSGGSNPSLSAKMWLTGICRPLFFYSIPKNLYNVIIVTPDGGYDSWYFDSPFVLDYQYETFLSSELVNYIDSNFNTIKDRSGREITGLSMGGHGALHTAIKHQDGRDDRSLF